MIIYYPASRDHVVSHHPESGIVFVSGGKWTTYREMLVLVALLNMDCRILSVFYGCIYVFIMEIVSFVDLIFRLIGQKMRLIK